MTNYFRQPTERNVAIAMKDGLIAVKRTNTQFDVDGDGQTYGVRIAEGGFASCNCRGNQFASCKHVGAAVLNVTLDTLEDGDRFPSAILKAFIRYETDGLPTWRSQAGLSEDAYPEIGGHAWGWQPSPADPLDDGDMACDSARDNRR